MSTGTPDEATLMNVRKVYERLDGVYSMKKIRYMMAWQIIPSVTINNRYYTTTRQVNDYIKTISFNAERNAEKFNRIKRWA